MTVRAALQPREQAPGPAEAERELRRIAAGPIAMSEIYVSRHKAIADELDRLRADVARLTKVCAAEEERDRLRALVRSRGGEP